MSCSPRRCRRQEAWRRKTSSGASYGVTSTTYAQGYINCVTRRGRETEGGLVTRKDRIDLLLILLMAPVDVCLRFWERDA